jgi:hypothetical protein
MSGFIDLAAAFRKNPHCRLAGHQVRFRNGRESEMIRLTFPLAAWLSLAGGPAEAGVIEPGAYQVTYRLEVPHVERFARDADTTVCAGAATLPGVLSGNNPLAHCPAGSMTRLTNGFTFEIHCPGRLYDSSRAKASYRWTDGGLEGRIEMVMGGKNMTFVEVQSWRRIGGCARLAGQ